MEKTLPELERKVTEVSDARRLCVHSFVYKNQYQFLLIISGRTYLEHT